MQDDVERLRSRWTPELTAAAIAALKGQPTAANVPRIEHGGATWLDLRGIRIDEVQTLERFASTIPENVNGCTASLATSPIDGP